MHQQSQPTSTPAVRRGRKIRFGSLRSRLRWSYALVSVTTLVVLGLALIGTSYRTHRQNVADSQKTAAEWLSREIHTSLSIVDDRLLQLGGHLGPAQAGDLEEISRLREIIPEIVDVAVLDHTGRERVHVSQLRVFHDTELVDRSSDALVRWTLTTGRVAKGPITQQSNGSLIYPSYAPIFNDNGRVIGAIRAEVSTSRIQQTLREAPLAEGSYAYLIDDTGAFQLTGDSHHLQTASPVMPSFVRSGETVQEYTGSQGTPVIGAWTAVPVQPAKWWAVVEIPRTIADAPLQRDRLFLITEVVLVIVTTVAWSIYQARQILRPIQELREGARTIGGGDLQSRIPIHTNDEIGELAWEFNQMAEHLQQSRDKIEHQNEHLRQGLALARDIQLGLLPLAPPGGAQHLTLRARSIPAYEVGGDFYTYIALDDSRMAVAIGDISGKGVGAALMMALASSTVEAQGRTIGQPDQLLAVLNGLLTARLKANRMNAALLYTVFDLSQRTMSVANAGMIAPILVRDGRVQFIDTVGLPLGVFAQARYSETRVELQDGDLILLVSDGVVEARRPDGELFGFERLERSLNDVQGPVYLEQLVDNLFAEVIHFMGEAEQHDDMTIVVVQPNLKAVTQHTHDAVGEVVA